MPKIPVQTLQTQTSGNLRQQPQTPAPTEQARALGNLAEGTRRFAGALQQRQARGESLRIMEQASALQTELTQDLEERLRTAQRGEEIVDPFMRHMQDRVSQLQEGIETPQGRDTLVRTTTRLQGALFGAAFEGQASLEERFALETYSNSMSEWAGSLIANPNMLDVTIQNHDDHVEALVREHGLSAAKASELRRKGHQTLTRASLRGAIRQDPDAALQELMTGPIEDIDPNEHQLWIDRAIEESETQRRARLAGEEAERKAAERAQKELESETFKNGLELLHTDQLTTEWVFENRDNLDDPDYRLLLDKVEADANTESRDVDVYSNLRVRAGSGEDVTEQARSALLDNQILAADYNIILNEIESNSPGAQIPSWYKRGVDYIRRNIGGDLAGPFMLQVQARVLDDWIAWADAHPGATVSEAREVYREYASQGLLDEGDVVSLPQPQFLQGSIQEPDLAATFRRTKESREEGEISQFEYDRQMVLLHDWKDRLEARERAQAERSSRPQRD